MTNHSRPLRIAEVLPAGVGRYSGITTVVIELAQRLSGLGHHLELWPLSPWDREESDYLREYLDPDVVPIIDGFPTLAHRLAALRARAVDVVHLHSVFSPPNNLLAAVLQPPLVLTPHGGYNPASLGRSAVRKRVYSFLLERRTVASAAATVALTEVERQDILSFAPRASTEVIPNGVKPTAGRPSVRARFRQKHQIDEQTPLVLFVGRLDVRHKGLDFLVQALRDAPEWTCAVVGPDSDGGADALRDMARKMWVSDRLLIVGPAHGEELEDAYASANVFALLSRWEGLPMSLLEACGRGLPSLVSTEVERLVPVAASGAGWAVDATQAGRVLNALVEGGLDLSAEADAAVALARTYNWDVVAAAYGRLFENVVFGAGAGA